MVDIVNLNCDSLLKAKKALKSEQQNFKMNKNNAKDVIQKKKSKLRQVKLDLKPNYSQAIIDTIFLSKEFKRNQLWNKFTSVSLFHILLKRISTEDF